MLRKRRSKKNYPIVIGLTGSIGMGKSTVARMFIKLGVPVLDSDKVVHRLLGLNGKAVTKVAELFPEVVREYSIDRPALGKIVFNDAPKLKTLEKIMHPLVQQEQKQFVTRMKRLGKKIIVLDIPLLFETGAEVRCNSVVVVTAPPFIQKQRVMRRKNMTTEKFQRILRLQISSKEKVRRADYIIHTGIGKATSLIQVRALLSKLKP